MGGGGRNIPKFLDSCQPCAKTVHSTCPEAGSMISGAPPKTTHPLRNKLQGNLGGLWTHLWEGDGVGGGSYSLLCQAAKVQNKGA